MGAKPSSLIAASHLVTQNRETAVRAPETVAKEQTLALAMACHKRLGSASPAAVLNTDSLQRIWELVLCALESERNEVERDESLRVLERFGMTQEDIQKLRDFATTNPEVHGVLRLSSTSALSLVSSGQVPLPCVS